MEAIPIDRYLAHANHFIGEIESAKAFLLDMERNPELVLTHSSDVFGSKRKEWFVVMGYREDRKDYLTTRDFMKHLARLINQHVEAWKEANGIILPTIVKIRDSNSSLFALYLIEEKKMGEVEDRVWGEAARHREVIQVDIFNKRYGQRTIEKGKVERLNQKDIASLRKEIEMCKQTIHEYEDILKQPNRHVKSIKDLCNILFKKKKLKISVEKAVASQTARIDQLEKDMDDIVEKEPELIKQNNRLVETAEFMIPLFVELGYVEEKEQHKLY